MLKAGWINFLSRDERFWDEAQKLADMGYKGMDGNLSGLPGDEKENRDRFHAMGLRELTTTPRMNFTPGGGISFDIGAMFSDIDAIKRDCEAGGYDRVTLFFSSAICSFFKGYGATATYDEMMADIDGINGAIAKLAPEGIKLAYHNHYQEFTTYHKGVSCIDHMLLGIDPRLVFDLDCGWITVAGMDPVAFMKRIEGRIAVIHLKDIIDIDACQRMSMAPDSPNGFTAMGTGLLDYAGCLKEADRQGIEWAIVEQDKQRHLGVIDALQCAILCMKETGLVG